MNLPLVVLAGTVGCFAADLFWYSLRQAPRSRRAELALPHRMEPDSCVRRTETRFDKWGPRTLLVCKFIPGLNTAAPALAGMVAFPIGRFVALRPVGGVLWTLAYALLGFIFSKQLDRVARDAHLLGGGLLILFVTGVIAYVLYRWRDRERFIEQVKGDRITPDELKHQLEAGEQPVIIDLRHPLDVLTDPRTLPGALQISPEELRRGTAKSPAMARSFSSVLDQTKRPAPGWRCNSKDGHSPRASAAGRLSRMEELGFPLVDISQPGEQFSSGNNRLAAEGRHKELNRFLPQRLVGAIRSGGVDVLPRHQLLRCHPERRFASFADRSRRPPCAPPG